MHILLVNILDLLSKTPTNLLLPLLARDINSIIRSLPRQLEPISASRQPEPISASLCPWAVTVPSGWRSLIREHSAKVSSAVKAHTDWAEFRLLLRGYGSNSSLQNHKRMIVIFIVHTAQSSGSVNTNGRVPIDGTQSK
ncbi:hypothetical protein Droror1_Dr00004428 [Drosera rotundifolia]